VLADRGYDADWIRALVNEQGAWANIPPKRNRKDPICFSPHLYRARNWWKRFFNKIKHCRRVATRYDKLAANYLAFVQLASIRLWLRFYEFTTLVYVVWDRSYGGTAQMWPTIACPNIVLLRRLMIDHGRTYGPRYAMVFGFMALVSGCTALSALMMKGVADDIFVAQDRHALMWLPLAIVAIFATKGLANYFQEVMLGRIGNRLVAETQQRMYEHLLKMDVAFFQRHPSSDLIARIEFNATAPRDMINLVILGVGGDALTLLGLIVVMVSQNPTLAIFALAVGPVYFIGIKDLVRRVQKAATSEIQSQITVIQIIRESVQGIKIAKSFQMEDALRSRMDDSLAAVERLNNRTTRVQARVGPLIETLAGLIIAGVVLYAGWRHLYQGDTPGQFVAFLTAILLAADPARRLARLRLQFAITAIGVRLMYDLMDTPASATGAPGMPQLLVTAGDVRFSGVRFAYEPSAPVFDDLNLGILPGKMNALVGLSGSGKTTIFNLLQRFWTPGKGKITIDGQSIVDVSLESLRRQISLVSQDPFLFEGTIRDNIRVGQDVSEETLIRAARAAHADGFIRELPNGYDTLVGELGSHLSGGQRQRISIARAFLKDAPIILLDEPTSALDSEAEQAIQTALADLMQNRTTIVIAHRLATVQGADIIHVIEEGRVVETGTHRQLIQRNGRYALFHRLQFSDVAVAGTEANNAGRQATSLVQ
jgi:ATP-binding cassette, subfamily B, bacterial MsbA